MMKKTVSAIIVSMLFSTLVLADQFESPMLDIEVPSGLEQNQMYISFGHKFYTPLPYYADPQNKDPFAVLDGGANLNAGFRYMFPFGIEAGAAYLTRSKEKNLQLSWNAVSDDLHIGARAGIGFFTFENKFQAFDSNFFYLIAMQSRGLLDDMVQFTLNAAYDGFSENAGMAAGIKVRIIKNFYAVGEYIPVIRMEKEDLVLGNTGIYNFGLIYQTFGHQFMLKFGNSFEMSLRKQMLGTFTQDMYAGFEIMRLISF